MYILVVLYLVFPAVQVYFFLSGQFGNNLADILNFVLSIFALHWLLANVIIASKIPWFQKNMPYDARIQFHILSTAGIVLAIIYHSVYYLTMRAAIEPVTWLIIIFLMIIPVYAVLWIPVPGFRKFRIWIVTKIKRGSELNYDRSKWFHGLLVLVLGFLMLQHVLEAGIFYSVSSVSSFLYGFFYAGSLGIYLLSLSPVFSVKSEIVDIEKRQGIIKIDLRPSKFFRYESGQFTFLEAKTSSKKKEIHPFSFLSSPENMSDKQSEVSVLSLAIRVVGDFTEELANLKPGDMVSLRGAYGNFRPGDEKALCFIASGIGIVPVFSILKNLYAANDKRLVHLFLAVDHEDEIPERDSLINIISAMINLKVHLLIYKEDGLRYSEEYFRKNLSRHKDYSYYICSSPGVRSVVLKALIALGVKKSVIHYETFSFG